MIAFIIGNAKSREGFDLEQLRLARPDDLIIGCNSLYEDFLPDVLVSFDSDISKDFHEKRPNTTSILNLDNKFGLIDGDYPIVDVPELEPYPGIIMDWDLNNSGQCAIEIAARQPNVFEIVLIGFDFFQPVHQDGINNIYSEVQTLRNENLKQNWTDFFQRDNLVDITRVGPIDDPFYRELGIYLMEYNDLCRIYSL